MGAAERRTSEWVDLVGDLLAQPFAAFPHQMLSARLHDTFDCQVSWNWMDPPGRAGFELHQPIDGWPTAEVLADLGSALDQHPVMRWVVVTGDLRPMTIGRVPRALVTPKGRQIVHDYLRPIDAEEQLAITYRFGPAEHRAFVLARGREDFPDEDLRVATALQSLLSLLDRQVVACDCADDATRASAYGLTGRELAVLALLAEGRTAHAIASRLRISERTVHRHLQCAYRKLGTHDRLTAVLTAVDAGLLLRPGAARASDRPD